MTENLTRWNRPKLDRFIYVDANAPVYLDQLRKIFAERFTKWMLVQQPSAVTDDESYINLLEQYNGERGDWAWEIARAFSRACHILTEYMNVYRNEVMVRTATQWNSLRQLGALVDYYPAPAVSATTWLAIECKQDGVLPKGFQVTHSSKSNQDQQIFETLTDVELYQDLNYLEPKDRQCNPYPLSTQSPARNILELNGQVTHLQSGKPIVLQDLRLGKETNRYVRVIDTILPQSDTTQIVLTRSLPNDLIAGYTLIYLEPQTEFSLYSTTNTYSSENLPTGITVNTSDELAIGDFLVLQQDDSLNALARITYLESSDDENKTIVTVDEWNNFIAQDYIVEQIQGYTHFAQQQRPSKWQLNTTPLISEITLQELPPTCLKTGSMVMVERTDQPISSLVTRIKKIQDNVIFLEDILPPDSNPNNIIIYGNLAEVSHGALQDNTILQSGDYTQANQTMDIQFSDISFIPDPTFTHGVKADITVTVDGQVWKQVSSLCFSAVSDAHYVVRVINQGYLRLTFGDGRQGRRLPSGNNNVAICYRRGSGLIGNFTAGSLETVIHSSDQVKKIRQPLPANGGNNLANLEEIRQGIITKSSTLNRGISLEDIERLTIATPSVWQARAQLMNNALRTQVQLILVPAGGGAVTLALADQIKSFVEINSIPGIKIIIDSYEPVPLDLDITVFTYAGFDQHKTIADQVLAKLEQDFSLSKRLLGQILYRGELYSSLVELEKVHTVTVKILSSTVANAVTKMEINIDAQKTIQYLKPALHQLIYLDFAAKKSKLNLRIEKVD